MNPLQIILITIIILISITFLIIVLFWLKIYWIQKKENKLLIKFNRLENNQAIKREKYIDTITTKDNYLKSISDFLKNSIKKHELHLKITKENIFLLRKIKIVSDFKEYKSKIQILEKDINLLNDSIKSIDKYALDSKAFKDSSLQLLIHIRKNFEQLELFYIQHLLPNEFYNNDIYELMFVIKDYLGKMNLSISNVNKNALIVDFNKVIKFILTFASWNLKVYKNWLKIIKIDTIFEKSKEIKNKYNLHFSSNELKEINEISKFIEDNLENCTLNLKKGKFNLVEQTIDEMLNKVFFFFTKINLVYEEQKILIDPIFNKNIVPSVNFMINSFNEWAGKIVARWINDFNNIAIEIFENCNELIQIIFYLNESKKNLEIVKQDIREKNNNQLLHLNLDIIQALNDVNLKFQSINEEIFVAQKKYKEIVQKILKLQIYIPQVLENAKKVVNDGDQSYISLNQIFTNVKNLSENVIHEFDNIDNFNNEYEILNLEFQIYKKIIENCFKQKIFAEKLYRYWFALCLKNNKFSENLNKIILENLEEKKWNHVITLIIVKISELKNEIQQNNISKNKSNLKKFWNKNRIA